MTFPYWYGRVKVEMKKATTNKKDKIMKTTFVVYSNIDEVHVMTKETEAEFIRRAVSEWKFNLDPDEGDFDRSEYESESIRIEPHKGFYID